MTTKTNNAARRWTVISATGEAMWFYDPATDKATKEGEWREVSAWAKAGPAAPPLTMQHIQAEMKRPYSPFDF